MAHRPNTKNKKGYHQDNLNITGIETAALPEDETPDRDPFVHCPVVGIVASAGGLDAIKKFFSAMPTQSGMAFVIVPHLDAKHPSAMAELISRQTSMAVAEVVDGESIQANRVFVIPPNRFLAIEDGCLRLSAIPAENPLATAIDFFLRSLAEDRSEKSIGIVLSGTGSHGTLGSREIKRCGGMVMAQSLESAAFDQMPRSAIETGLVDFVLAPEQMPDALMRYAQQPYLSVHATPSESSDNAVRQLRAIISLIRAQTKYDFSCYRANMLVRRIQRRLGILQVADLTSYIEILKVRPEEVSALCRDFLIGVTAFFREPAAYKALEDGLVAELVARQQADVPIRVWVPGCATGEEAYSIAIVFFDAFRRAGKTPRLQIFASDINERSIEIARRGRYPSSIASDVPAERLRQYFTALDELHYQVREELRDSIVFSLQNLVCDAPFSRLDLISCRNLMIYLEPEMQQRLISLFHYALGEHGYLTLGASETIGRATNLFETVSKEWRIFRRLSSSERSQVTIPLLKVEGHRQAASASAAVSDSRKNYKDLTERIVLSEFSPASVLINRRYEILYLSGPLVNYLEFPAGEPTKDLLAIARPGLRAKIRSACLKAIRDGATVVESGARVRRDSKYHACSITVRMVVERQDAEGLMLVIFKETHRTSTKAEGTNGNADASELEPTTEDMSLVRELEFELKSTREDLQDTLEEMESSNEELQSSNEELESSREELQSLNEELSTVNSQLQEKVNELDKLNTDLTNLMSSTEIATLFLDDELRIKRFTQPTTQLFRLSALDEGRLLREFASPVVDSILLEQCQRVLNGHSPIESEIQTENKRFYLRRVLPYSSVSGRIEGVVVAFLDLTERKILEASQRERDARFREVFEHAATGIAITDRDGFYVECNPAFRNLFQYSEEELQQLDILSLVHPDDEIECRAGVESLLAGKVTSFESEGRSIRKNGQVVWVQQFFSTLPNESGSRANLVMLVTNVTERKVAERKLKESKQLLQLVMDTVPHFIYARDCSGKCLFANQYAATQFGFASPAEMVELATRDDSQRSIPFLNLDHDDLEVLKTGVPHIFAEQQLTDHEGKLSIVQTSKSRFKLPGASENALLTVSVDITDRKNAETKLRESRERIRAVLNTASDAIVTIDKLGVIDSVNDATESMFGYQRSELIGQTVGILMPRQFSEKHGEYLARYLRTGEARVIGGGREVVCRRKDGSTFPADLAVSQVDHLGLFTGILRDISNRKEMEKHILEIAADQQRRIGLELHDGTQQELTGLSLYANALLETIGAAARQETPETVSWVLSDQKFQSLRHTASMLSKHLAEANRHVRELAHGIMPVQIDAEGLRAALSELANSINEHESVHCSFVCKGNMSILNNTTATHLFRIAQEAINNALRHGHANEIKITLLQESERTTLEIEDNGVGFEGEVATHNSSPSRGMGLRLMEYRASIIGGVIQMESRKGGGAVIRCAVVNGIRTQDE